MTNTKSIQKKTKSIFNTHTMVKVGLLSAVSLVFMMLDFSVPLFPAFLELDISDIPAIVGTLSMGSLAGIAIELIKNILHGIMATSTMGIGEVANFCFGAAYIIPLGLIYNKNKDTKSVVLGLVLGTVSMTILACILNYFILIPLYSAVVFNQPISAFVSMANAANSMVKDFSTMILFAVAPFNILKGVIISGLGYYLYKLLKPVLHRL